MIGGAAAAAVGLREVGSDEGVAELRRLGLERLGAVAIEMRPGDRDVVLQAVHAETILRALPIHQDTSGVWRPMGPHCYWEGVLQMPANLPRPPVLLRRSNNPRVRHAEDGLAREIGRPCR